MLTRKNQAPMPTSALASVNEGNESPEQEAPNLDAILSSPAPTPKTPAKPVTKPSFVEMHPSKVHDSMMPSSPVVRTPAKSAIQPSKEEMHPSKVHERIHFENTSIPSPAPREKTMQLPSQTPKTPGKASGIKPPMSEMHPSKVHGTMAPPSSGLRLGFTDIKPTVGKSALPIAAHSTPTKVGINVPSGDFTFRSTGMRGPMDLGLGPEAQRMMDELREEAMKIKEELAAKRELEKAEEEKNGRKMIKPKGKAGRYSAVHMAEFKKMDSIENHPSAFRAAPGRVTPVKSLKRTQSKANLNDSKGQTPISAKPKPKPTDKPAEPEGPAKRARQRMEDDTSSARPISRDGSNIPRPKSSGTDSLHRARSNASLMTPTKSSLLRATGVKTPSAIRPPSMLSGMKRTTTAKSAITDRFTRALSPNITVRSPSGRFGKTMAFLRGERFGTDKSKSAIPLASDKPTGVPSASATPATPSADTSKLNKPLPSLPVPVGTPGRAQSNHIAFTPETKRVIATQTTPSPVKSAIPRSTVRKVLQEVRYPTLDTVMTGETNNTDDADVSYPDLSGARPLPAPPTRNSTAQASPAPPSAPSTFSFRSDHTINFGDASARGFGASPGHPTVRQVRPSIPPTFDMPGSFPNSSVAIMSPINKENEAPVPPSNMPAPSTVYKAIPHGMINKKRHRVSDDEQDAEQEAADRAAKKRRGEVVPEGEALLAPRLMASARKQPSLTPAKRFGVPSSVPGTPSPKKKAGISMSRLQMLSRPKNRK